MRKYLKFKPLLEDDNNLARLGYPVVDLELDEGAWIAFERDTTYYVIGTVSDVVDKDTGITTKQEVTFELDKPLPMSEILHEIESMHLELYPDANINAVTNEYRNDN